MPPKRKLKHVPPITSAAPPNSSDQSPSPHGQGQQSNPSTAHSGFNTIAESSVQPTAQSTPDHEASDGPPAKKTCGLSRGLAAQRIMDRSKQKLPVQAKEGDMRTFGRMDTSHHQKDKEKDNVISELTQRLKQQAVLIQSLIARMDTSHHPSTPLTNDLPPPPLSVGTVLDMIRDGPKTIKNPRHVGGRVEPS